ncbi:hypothetical protein [Candidatus Clostridium stratigraminis]|uniref:Uncharacterized protein n=1 Tax=Candidatus Clostridium stratigraminis TaxID=3381661 RepID=A0ABW8SYM5_9CLOT
MEKNKLIKFAVIYLISLIIGNLIISIVDRIGVSRGLSGWTIWNYLIFNALIIFISYLSYRFMPNGKRI